MTRVVKHSINSLFVFVSRCSSSTSCHVSEKLCSVYTRRLPRGILDILAL
jgi:hypothetical protein